MTTVFTVPVTLPDTHWWYTAAMLVWTLTAAAALARYKIKSRTRLNSAVKIVSLFAIGFMAATGIGYSVSESRSADHKLQIAATDTLFKHYGWQSFITQPQPGSKTWYVTLSNLRHTKECVTTVPEHMPKVVDLRLICNPPHPNPKTLKQLRAAK